MPNLFSIIFCILILTERETIQELTKMLRAKRAQELAEERENILREIPKLSTRAPEVFARLDRKYLGIRTSELARRIINDGYEDAFAQVVVEVSTKYNIDLEDIRNIITANKASYKKDRGLVRQESIVAGQISKYANRAKGRVEEHPKK